MSGKPEPGKLRHSNIFLKKDREQNEAKKAVLPPSGPPPASKFTPAALAKRESKRKSEIEAEMKAAAAANKTQENGFSFAQFWIEFTEEIGIGEDDGKGKEKSSVKKKSIPAGNKTKI